MNVALLVLRDGECLMWLRKVCCGFRVPDAA